MPARPTIEASFQLTEREIYEANVSIALHRYRTVIRLLAVFAVIISTMFVAALISGTPALRSFTPGTVFLTVLAPLFFIATLFASSYRAAKEFARDNPSLQGPTIWRFSDDGISIHGPGGTSKLPWKSYILARETKTLFLLYPQANFANVVPKRAFAGESELAEFRALLAQHALLVS